VTPHHVDPQGAQPAGRGRLGAEHRPARPTAEQEPPHVLAADFIRKIWFPAGMVAVAVTFVLAFLLDDPVSDNVVGAILGGVLIGLPVLYAVYRNVSGPKTARD
jgi:hypothetical protein